MSGGGGPGGEAFSLSPARSMKNSQKSSLTWWVDRSTTLFELLSHILHCDPKHLHARYLGVHLHTRHGQMVRFWYPRLHFLSARNRQNTAGYRRNHDQGKKKSARAREGAREEKYASNKATCFLAIRVRPSLETQRGNRTRKIGATRICAKSFEAHLLRIKPPCRHLRVAFRVHATRHLH